MSFRGLELAPYVNGAHRTIAWIRWNSRSGRHCHPEQPDRIHEARDSEEIARADLPSASFTGVGECEPDATDKAAAMRELRKKSAFLKDAEYIGPLDEVRTIDPLPPIIIRPHLFFMRERVVPVLNEEVASIHYLSLDDLFAGHGRATINYPWPGSEEAQFPCVDFDGVRLWGLVHDDDRHTRVDGLRVAEMIA